MFCFLKEHGCRDEKRRDPQGRLAAVSVVAGRHYKVGLANAALQPLQRSSCEGRSSTGNFLSFKNKSTERIIDHRVPGLETRSGLRDASSES